MLVLASIGWCRYRLILNLVLPPIPVVMPFVGSSAGYSFSSAELGVGITYSRLLYCSCWTVVQWWMTWPVYKGSVTMTRWQAWPLPCRNRYMS